MLDFGVFETPRASAYDEVRCRFVVMQIATGARFDVFAETPPPDFVKLALSLAASRRTFNEEKQ